MTNDEELVRRGDVLALVEHHVTDDDDRMTLRASIAALPAAPSVQQTGTPPEVLALVDTFYIDCEFDGHNGPLLSIAMVRGDGRSVYIKVGDVTAKDPWVISNVLPILNSDNAENTWDISQNDVGMVLRMFLKDCQNPTIIADSPVDIGRFCQAISTGSDGRWESTDFSRMTLSVHNIDCYPTTLEGAIQHNAWWDAMALRAALAEIKGESHD